MAVQEVLSELVFACKETPIHLDVPSEGVARAYDSGEDPGKEEEIVHT